ncbi:hypothetical protein FOCC_FOCC006260, partial [Frankliniella occidentalis]
MAFFKVLSCMAVLAVAAVYAAPGYLEQPVYAHAVHAAPLAVAHHEPQDYYALPLLKATSSSSCSSSLSRHPSRHLNITPTINSVLRRLCIITIIPKFLGGHHQPCPSPF